METESSVVACLTEHRSTFAGFAYRTLLSDPALLPFSRTDANIDTFWATGHNAWPPHISIDNDALASP